MTYPLRHIILILLFCLLSTSVCAQNNSPQEETVQTNDSVPVTSTQHTRRVSAVEQIKTTSPMQTLEGKRAAQRLVKKEKIDPKLLLNQDSVIHLRDKLREDSLRLPSNVYLRLYELSFGLNIWDPVMRVFNQKYGIADVSVDMNFHNRWIACAELGLGTASISSSDKNYRYTTPLSFYAKIGGNYNFLFRKDHRYSFYAGFRVGFSAFKYSVEGTVSSPYWREDSQTFRLDGLNSSAVWGEILAGLKIKIVKNFSMGWAFRYRIIMSYKKNDVGDPIYIPGLGKHSQAISGSFSLYYDLPFYKKDDLTRAEKLMEEYSNRK